MATHHQTEDTTNAKTTPRGPTTNRHQHTNWNRDQAWDTSHSWAHDKRREATPHYQWTHPTDDPGWTTWLTDENKHHTRVDHDRAWDTYTQERNKTAATHDPWQHAFSPPPTHTTTPTRRRTTTQLTDPPTEPENPWTNYVKQRNADHMAMFAKAKPCFTDPPIHMLQLAELIPTLKSPKATGPKGVWPTTLVPGPVIKAAPTTPPQSKNNGEEADDHQRPPNQHSERRAHKAKQHALNLEAAGLPTDYQHDSKLGKQHPTAQLIRNCLSDNLCSPARAFKAWQQDTDICPFCEGAKGTTRHILWICQSVAEARNRDKRLK